MNKALILIVVSGMAFYLLWDDATPAGRTLLILMGAASLLMVVSALISKIRE